MIKIEVKKHYTNFKNVIVKAQIGKYTMSFLCKNVDMFEMNTDRVHNPDFTNFSATISFDKVHEIMYIAYKKSKSKTESIKLSRFDYHMIADELEFHIGKQRVFNVYPSKLLKETNKDKIEITNYEFTNDIFISDKVEFGFDNNILIDLTPNQTTDIDSIKELYPIFALMQDKVERLNLYKQIERYQNITMKKMTPKEQIDKLKETFTVKNIYLNRLGKTLIEKTKMLNFLTQDM